MDEKQRAEAHRLLIEVILPACGHKDAQGIKPLPLENGWCFKLREGHQRMTKGMVGHVLNVVASVTCNPDGMTVTLKPEAFVVSGPDAERQVGTPPKERTFRPRAWASDGELFKLAHDAMVEIVEEFEGITGAQ